MEESRKKVGSSKPDRGVTKKHTRNGSSSHVDAMDAFQNNKKKSKIAGEETEKDPCGICLAEEGVNARGEMDCCEHYFCFACIVEWAKVESRCPTCRRRFTTIRRSSRTIKVPLRDQVHIPLDEDNQVVQDPYADVFCTECNSRNDDSLLLLCDLCDSAAHTYCVGLGRTVPTGEWYCRECKASSDVHSDTKEDDDDKDFVLECCDSDITSRGSLMTRAASTSETVENVKPQRVLPSSFSRHASSTPNLSRVRRRVIRRKAPRLSNAARAFSSQFSASATAAQVSGPASLLPSGASRTLSGQRILQERIQAMRENWKALQHGELQFSSQPFCFNNRMTDRADKLAQSAPNKHLKNKQGPDNQADIDRAWAMMERAKSLGGKDLGLDDRQKAEKSHLVLCSSQMNRNFSEDRLRACSRPIERTTANSRIDSTSSARHNNSVSSDRISSLGFMPLPFSEHSTTSSAKLVPQIGSSSKSGNQAPTSTIFKEEHVAKPSGNLSQRSNEADATAKEKILSFVKTYLMKIHKSKQLGNIQFKEIARISTQKILAACGLQHSGQRELCLKPICCHHSNQQRQSPRLMPMCCNECFDSFVKDMVNGIADENLRK